MKSLLILHTCGITPKRVTSGGAHLRGIAPGQLSSEETSQRWWAVGDTVIDLTDPGLEPQTSSTDCNVFTPELTHKEYSFHSLSMQYFSIPVVMSALCWEIRVIEPNYQSGNIRIFYFQKFKNDDYHIYIFVIWFRYQQKTNHHRV